MNNASIELIEKMFSRLTGSFPEAKESIKKSCETVKLLEEMDDEFNRMGNHFTRRIVDNSLILKNADMMEDWVMSAFFSFLKREITVITLATYCNFIKRDKINKELDNLILSIKEKVKEVDAETKSTNTMEDIPL